MKGRSSVVSLKELSFGIVLILLQIVVFSATADGRSLRVFEPESYERHDEMLASELEETIFVPDVSESPMGSFSQVPMPEQSPPPLSSPAPICAYPPSTLPSPTNIPSSPPQVPSTLPSPTSYPSSPTPPPPSTLPSPTSNPSTPPPPTPSTLPSPTSNPPPYLPAQGPPPPFLPAQVPPAPPCLPTQVPPPTLSIPPPLQSSPPTSIPTPPAHNPTVPVMPYTPPPMGKKPGSGSGSWCVSKPTVSDTILQRGLDYACGMGADCKQIQPGGPCFQPNTVSAHSSFAFNSYWQKGKAAGGTCDFGGTAMIVTIDPSYNGCRFTSN